MKKISLFLLSSLSLISVFSNQQNNTLDTQDQQEIISIKDYLPNQEIEGFSDELKNLLIEAITLLSKNLENISENTTQNLEIKEMYKLLKDNSINLRLITQIAPYKTRQVIKDESQNIQEQQQQELDNTQKQYNELENSNNENDVPQQQDFNAGILKLKLLVENNELFKNYWNTYLVAAQEILNSWFSSEEFQKLTQVFQAQGIYVDIMVNILIDTISSSDESMNDIISSVNSN
jgi:hypothetical protein